MHTFLNLLIESQFNSFLKLINPFVITYTTITFNHSKSSLCCLGTVRSCQCVLSLGWHEGLVQTHNVMPFGLLNGPATFIAFIHDIDSM
jgi:hypothetical protein